jgi:hypothetical protein
MGLEVLLMEKEVSDHPCTCSDCGMKHTTSYQKTLFSKTITHNLSKMAAEAGIDKILWYPENNEIETASDMINGLSNGLAQLLKDPNKFKKYNPENGWGTYEGLVKFVEEYLEACFKHRDAIVVAER